MSTEMVLLQAEIARSTVMGNERMMFIGVIGLIAVLVLWGEYVLRRWSWVPRKRRDRIFIEKF